VADDPLKRPGSMGDAARARIGAVHRRTPPRGYPIEVDPEVTPGPQPVPRNLDEIGQALDALAQRAHRSRHDSDRLDRIETRLGDVDRESTQTATLLTQSVWPGLKKTMGDLDGLLQRQSEAFAEQKAFFDREWPEVLRSLGELAKGLATLRRELDHLATDQRATDKRVDANERRTSLVEQRVQALETTAAVEQRVVALTGKQKAVYGGIATILSFLSGLASRFFT
jgi:hypothetical protein